jgi:hypothetical protein
MPAAKLHPNHKACVGLSVEAPRGKDHHSEASAGPAAALPLAKTLRLPTDALHLELHHALATAQVALASGRASVAAEAARVALCLCGCAASVSPAEAAAPAAALVASAHRAAVLLPMRARACFLMARSLVCGYSCLETGQELSGKPHWRHPLSFSVCRGAGGVDASLAACAAQPWIEAGNCVVESFPAVAASAACDGLLASAIVSAAGKQWPRTVEALRTTEENWTVNASPRCAAQLQCMLARAVLEASLAVGDRSGLWMARAPRESIAEALRRVSEALRLLSPLKPCLSAASAMEGKAVLLAAAAKMVSADTLTLQASALAEDASRCKDEVLAAIASLEEAVGRTVDGTKEIALVLGSHQ